MGSHLLGDSACDINSDFGILLIMCPFSVFVVTVRDAGGRDLSLGTQAREYVLTHMPNEQAPAERSYSRVLAI
jgi:hypothetical protein